MPDAARRGGVAWTAWVGAATVPLIATLCVVMWRTPYPISEAVALIGDAAASSAFHFFDPAVRSWYRPVYQLTWHVLVNGTGSIDAALFWFRLIEVG